MDRVPAAWPTRHAPIVKRATYAAKWSPPHEKEPPGGPAVLRYYEVPLYPALSAVKVSTDSAWLFLSVLFHVGFAGFFGVMLRMVPVTRGCVGMMGCLFMLPAAVMLGRLAMMMRGTGVVFLRL
jgi:hypothetical protein